MGVILNGTNITFIIIKNRSIPSRRLKTKLIKANLTIFLVCTRRKCKNITSEAKSFDCWARISHFKMSVLGPPERIKSIRHVVWFDTLSHCARMTMNEYYFYHPMTSRPGKCGYLYKLDIYFFLTILWFFHNFSYEVDATKNKNTILRQTSNSLQTRHKTAIWCAKICC